MNAIKSLSAALLALGTITTLATAPVVANPSVLETLDRLEERSAAKSSDARRLITRSNKSVLDTLDRLEDRSAAKSSDARRSITRSNKSVLDTLDRLEDRSATNSVARRGINRAAK